MPHKNNIFLRAPDGYNRNLDVLGTATKLAAQYLHLKTNKPMEDCIAFVQRETAAGGSMPTKSINLKVLKRQPNQDRAKASVTFDSVIKDVIKDQSVLAPNFVIYDNAKVNKSCTSKYVEDKLTLRSVVKKMGLKAEQTGDKVVQAYCHNSEYGIKILNNSLSGAHASPHNALFNKTAHSSLTSTTRVIVSYSNASTEKLLEGNRHYHSKDVVIENILSIINFADYDSLNALMLRYQLYVPSVEDVLELITRCTDFYWMNEVWDLEIRDVVSRLTDIQRVAFTYLGDLYHLAKFNDGVVRSFITEMIERPVTNTTIDAESVIGAANNGVKALTGILCADILAGSTVEDMRKGSEEHYYIYACTIQHVNDTVCKYGDLLTGLLVTDIVPSSIYAFPSSIRRCVVGSDTDSTMFTVQSWIEWYFGRLAFGHTADKVSNVMCYLNTQIVGHMLATASKNMGVEDRNLYRLEMKNEYGFPVYIRANRAKHYATLQASREGNVYKVPKNDIKGVGLKDSKVPKNIMARLEKEINNIMMGIVAEKGVDIYPLMQRIANLEHEIFTSLKEGRIEYLSTVNISSIHAYKNPMASKYMHYDLWVNVFQHKFGVIDQPPYRAIKVSTTLNKTKLVLSWLEGLDPVLADAMTNWLNTNKRKEQKPSKAALKKLKATLAIAEYPDDIEAAHEEYERTAPAQGKLAVKFEQLLLPYELFENGIPKEFLSVIDSRKIVSELMAGFYILLEMIGFYIKNKDSALLLSDDKPHRPEFGLPGDKL